MSYCYICRTNLAGGIIPTWVPTCCNNFRRECICKWCMDAILTIPMNSSLQKELRQNLLENKPLSTEIMNDLLSWAKEKVKCPHCDKRLTKDDFIPY